MSWTLLYAGAERTLADWGLNHLSRKLVSQNRDTVTFDADGAPFDADHLFDFRKTVVIKKDGVQWFVGTVIKIPRQGQPRAERLTYELAGPWYFLDQLEFKQTWSFYVGKIKNTNFFTSHLLLNNNNGALLTTRDQFLAILNYAIAQAQADPATPLTPFQIGKVLEGTALQMPPDEVRDLTCAECLRKQLRLHPDAVTWFDYTTTPPTFNCALRSKLSAVNLQVPPPLGGASSASLASTPNISELSVTPRYDLLRPAVAIQYEVRTTIDSQDYLSILTDLAPATATGREIGALTATIDLQGPKITTVKISLRTDPINPADLNWWKNKFPDLANQIVNLKFADDTTKTPVVPVPIGRNLRNPDGTLTPTLGLPFEVIEGQVASWMQTGGNPASAQQEEIATGLTYDLYDQDGLLQRKGKENEYKCHKCVTTNMPSGDYQTVSSITTGDPQPVGLAAYLYSALSLLQYEGGVKLIEQECAGFLLVGSVLNLLGGRPEWTTMNAMIQTVTEEVDTGATKITFGPPEQLGPSQIVELLRFNRGRFRLTPLSAQSDAILGSAANSVQLGKQTANSNAIRGQNLDNFLTIKSQPAGNPALPATLLTHDAKSAQVNYQQGANQILMQLPKCNGRKLYIREVEVCVNNATMHMLCLCTDPY